MQLVFLEPLNCRLLVSFVQTLLLLPVVTVLCLAPPHSWLFEVFILDSLGAPYAVFIDEETLRDQLLVLAVVPTLVQLRELSVVGLLELG